MTVLGIDIGGSGIKGAPVDIEAGALTDERYRLETPHPATPDAVVSVLGEVANHWKGSDPIGVTFPGVVKHGVSKSNRFGLVMQVTASLSVHVGAVTMLDAVTASLSVKTPKVRIHFANK